MSPKVRVRAAWALLAAAVVGWPLCALTVARQEPPVILGLSFLAIVITCLDVVSTQDVRSKQEGEGAE